VIFLAVQNESTLGKTTIKECNQEHARISLFIDKYYINKYNIHSEKDGSPTL
jgi:hypothetical protein